MLKRWCSIKEIEVYLLCEILISKDTLQGQNKLLRAAFNLKSKSDRVSGIAICGDCSIRQVLGIII